MKQQKRMVKKVHTFVYNNMDKIFIIFISLLLSEGISHIPYINVILIPEFRWAIISIYFFIVFHIKLADVFRFAIILFILSSFLSFTHNRELIESIGNFTYVILWFGVIRSIPLLRAKTSTRKKTPLSEVALREDM